MGVPRFYRYIKDRFPKTITTKLPENAVSLAIDMNGVFHQVAAKVYGYDESYTPQEKMVIQTKPKKVLDSEFFRGVVTKIYDLVKLVRPREYLILAVDGVAPLAKIQQQRQRRY